MSKSEDRKQLNMSLSYKQYSKLVRLYKSYVETCKDALPMQVAAWARDEVLNKI